MNIPNDYGDPRAEYRAAYERAAWFDLSDRGKIELAGKEAVFFLNNLCTNDVKNLAVSAGCEAFLCTAKAKVVAHLFVSHVEPEVLLLDFEPGQAEKVFNHLNHFLISEQVELADRTNEFAVLQLVGPKAAAILSTAVGTALPALQSWQHVAMRLANDEVIVRANASLQLPAFDCICAAALKPVLAERLVQSGATPAGDQTHEILRVEAGWPAYGIDMDENRFVVEVGRTAQAISYAKGCFLGQEPIVMARDRGQVNRQLLGVLCGAGRELAAGTRLLQRDVEVGQVTSSVVSPRLVQAIALAYIKRGSQNPGTALTIDAPTGRREATVSALPFSSSNTPC